MALLHPPLSRGRPGSCRLPVVLFGRGAVRQPRLGALKCRSGSQHRGPYPARKRWFAPSHLPLDRISQPRSPEGTACVPATAHADLSWPRASRGRPHRQARAVRWSGRRRRNKTLRTCGSNRAKRLIGKLTNKWCGMPVALLGT